MLVSDLSRAASALDDQIQCWFKADLGTDLLTDLVERGRFRDFSLQGSLVPLERRSHLIERLRKPSNFVLRSDVDDNVALAGGDLVSGVGETTDGTGQSSHTIYSEQQRTCKTDSRDDEKANRDETRTALKVVDGIGKVDDHRSQ